MPCFNSVTKSPVAFQNCSLALCVWVTAERQSLTLRIKRSSRDRMGDMGKTRHKPSHHSAVCRHLYLASHGAGLSDGHTDVRLVDFCRKNCISNKKKPQRSTSTWLEDAETAPQISGFQHFISDNSNAEIIIEITNIYVSASIRQTLFSAFHNLIIYILPHFIEGETEAQGSLVTCPS